MKKKWIVMGLLACILTACAACNGSGTESSSPSAPPASESSMGKTSQEENSSSVENSFSIESGTDSNGDTSEDTSGNTSEDTSNVQYYTVTFDTDGDSEVAPIQVKEGEKAARPEDPDKSSKDCEYEFIGWYYGETEWDFDNGIITQNITLTAKWKTLESYTPPFLPKN